MLRIIDAHLDLAWNALSFKNKCSDSRTDGFVPDTVETASFSSSGEYVAPQVSHESPY